MNKAAQTTSRGCLRGALLTSATGSRVAESRVCRPRVVANGGLHVPGQPALESVALASCRTVGGALDHGDERRPSPARLGRTRRGLHHFRRLCRSDSSHPADHGGALGFLARPAPALVRAAALQELRVRGGRRAGCGAGQRASRPESCDIASVARRSLFSDVMLVHVYKGCPIVNVSSHLLLFYISMCYITSGFKIRDTSTYW